MPGDQIRVALELLGASPLKLAVYSNSLNKVPSGVLLWGMPQDVAAAHELFAVLGERDA